MPARPMLLLFTQRGCSACAAARPEFERYKSRNPLQMALELDADGPWAAQLFGKRIRSTPLYVLRTHEASESHEGMMKLDQLEKWVKASSWEG